MSRRGVAWEISELEIHKGKSREGASCPQCQDR
jgi:hypothetical protein